MGGFKNYPNLFFLAFVSTLWLGTPRECQGQGLNDLFGLPIWIDNHLWDDQAWNTAQRLNLRGTQGRQANETYRAGFAGKIQALGQPLFAVDLYPQNGETHRLLLGFVNEADFASAHPSDLVRARNESFDALRIALTKRLGRRSGQGNSLHWTWLSHSFHLQNTEKAVLLDIKPGTYRPNASPTESLTTDKRRAATPTANYVERSRNGDVLISGIPKISQGDRGYCVPASWEKVLRHYGLGFNVYDLAIEGRTTINGSYFHQFTSEMISMLKPHRYQVERVHFSPDNLKGVATYIDRGLPLIWHMDAYPLRPWVERNQRRRTKLPDGPDLINPTSTINGHALLIIGYNLREKEMALSDSTELGSSIAAIWIRQSEAGAVHQRRTDLLAVIPPGKESANPDFLKARWY